MCDKSMEALDLAIATEKETEAFYKEWVEEVESSAVEVLFADLAATEHDHMEKLSRIKPDHIVASSDGEQQLGVWSPSE